MNEWKSPSVELPAEGALVEIRLPGGQRVKPVEYAAGRFWKVRAGTGGHAYEPDGWRAIEPAKRRDDGRTESSN